MTRARDIQLFALDVDGVLTDGTIFYTEEGEELKAFHAHDGLGIKLLMNAGVQVAVISGRQSPPLVKRLQDLGVEHFRLNCGDKVTALHEICESLGFSMGDAAFMGDDLIDHEVMQSVSYAVAPANACAEIKEIADFVTEREGGKGAVRDACEHIAERIGTSLFEQLETGTTN